VRTEELRWIRASAIIGAFNFFIIAAIPILATVLTFLVFTATGHILTPQKAFVALSLFSVLRMPLFLLPQIIAQVCRWHSCDIVVRDTVCGRREDQSAIWF